MGTAGTKGSDRSMENTTDYPEQHEVGSGTLNGTEEHKDSKSSTTSTSISSTSTSSTSSPLIPRKSGAKWGSEAKKRTPLNKEEVTKVETINQKKATEILNQHKELKTMMDRTGRVPVSKFILSTLQSGLPLFQNQTTINNDIKYCLNYIFYRVKEEKDINKKKKISYGSR